MLELFTYEISIIEFALLIISAMFVGMSKTGIPGAGMIAIPLMVLIFGSKSSTGILLPILIFADVCAVYYYNRYANWSHLKRLLPITLLGVILASIAGHVISDNLFQLVMAIIIFAALGLMTWQEVSQQKAIPTSTWFVVFIGIIGGFASMIGNMAGPIMALYLLAMRFPKNEFIGTGAWFFLCINIMKLPFHIFIWQTINLNTLGFDLIMIPAIAIGALFGIKLVKKVPERGFRYFVIFVTFLGAVGMVL